MDREEKERVQYLFSRYINRLSTDAEYNQFLEILSHSEKDNVLNELLSDLWREMDEKGNIESLELQIPEKKYKRNWFSAAGIAASIILILSGVFFWHYYQIQNVPSSTVVKLQAADILPGGNKAILTLADGKKISLTDHAEGNIAVQNHMRIQKNADGQVVYLPQSVGTPLLAGNAFNTLSTPRGGQYHVVLSDGTEVWLNAASSITYPVAFTGKERKVSVTGEAYFKVVHNATMPFHVVAAGQIIEDIGTEFNVNAYSDEASVLTTLVGGKVKVSMQSKSVLLVPGEQAVSNNDGIAVRTANLSVAIAWKNGFFEFDKADIQTVMRQISRWYEVTVSYKGKIPETKITGKVYRNANLSDALQILQYLDVRFQVNGKNITIMP